MLRRILLLSGLVLAGCSTLCRDYCRQNPEIQVQVLPPVSSCLTEPPPVDRPVVATEDESCPAQFALCLDVDAGLALERNLRAGRRWAKEAWARCSVADAGASGAEIDGGR